MTRTWGLLDSAGIPDLIYNIVCDQTYKQARFCRKLLNAIAGPNPDNIELVRFNKIKRITSKCKETYGVKIKITFSKDLIPLVGSNYLQGTSVPVMAQFAQNYFAGKLCLKTE